MKRTRGREVNSSLFILLVRMFAGFGASGICLCHLYQGFESSDAISGAYIVLCSAAVVLGPMIATGAFTRQSAGILSTGFLLVVPASVITATEGIPGPAALLAAAGVFAAIGFTGPGIFSIDEKLKDLSYARTVSTVLKSHRREPEETQTVRFQLEFSSRKVDRATPRRAPDLIHAHAAN